MTRPEILVGKTDYDKLIRIASGLLENKPELADELIGELERAAVRTDDALPEGIVRMGSTLEYRTENGQARRVTLVYPMDADITEGRISILTPIGTALLGLARGDTIDFVANDGRQHLLTVVSVET
jgi:regulator of nucleoside diphosphate kinase